MSDVKTVFAFRFIADLDGHYVRLLRDATNMRIGDVENPWKDTPGRGKIVPEVNIHLWRPSAEPNDWQIDATTRQRDYDDTAVEACRQRLTDLLPKISLTWEELIPTSATGVADEQA
ncbi:hypothetical protein ACIBI3_33520 [Actinomadura luteofluorescens]|uniref:hypothetical protein n=1 Tax=Actinomadura luteofluorescens TaxID=46163 RepID=UPI00348A3776